MCVNVRLERDRERNVRCKRTTSIVKRHDLVVRIHASPMSHFLEVVVLLVILLFETPKQENTSLKISRRYKKIRHTLFPFHLACRTKKKNRIFAPLSSI